MEKRFVGIGAVAVAVVGIVIGVFLYRSLVERPGYSETGITKGSLTETLSLEGKVRPVREADLGFESGGRITELSHAVGDHAEKGEVLARIGDADSVANYDRSVALARSAQANLDYYDALLKKENEKLKSLKKADANTPDKNAQRNQIDASAAQVSAQQAALEAAKAAVRDARAQIEKKIIRAPFSGTLAKRDVETDEVVSAGSVIMTLIDESDFETEAFVSQLDAKAINIGDVAEIFLDTDAGNAHPAHVTSVDKAETLRNGVSTYKVTLAFDGRVEGVRSGTDANVKMTLSNRVGTISVPKTAVYSENGHTFVSVSAAGTREKREVSTGIRDDDGMVEITGGLREGDVVSGLSN